MITSSQAQTQILKMLICSLRMIQHWTLMSCLNSTPITTPSNNQPERQPCLKMTFSLLHQVTPTKRLPENLCSQLTLKQVLVFSRNQSLFTILRRLVSMTLLILQQVSTSIGSQFQNRRLAPMTTVLSTICGRRELTVLLRTVIGQRGLMIRVSLVSGRRWTAAKQVRQSLSKSSQTPPHSSMPRLPVDQRLRRLMTSVMTMPQTLP